jgi:hypothetical protein
MTTKAHIDDEQLTARPCGHPRLLDVRTEGGAILGYQCSRCPATWAHCNDCGTPIDQEHFTRRTGCVKCGRGKFCSVKARFCYRCSPVTDGVCPICKGLFAQNGRQLLARKRFCSRSCARRARRSRPAAGAAACSPA